MQKGIFLSNLRKLVGYNEIKIFLEELVRNWDNIDNEIIYYAMKKAQEISNEFEYQIFYNPIYKGAQKNYSELISSCMVPISEQTFLMGSAKNSDMVYCGEHPQHEVHLDSFMICNTVITSDIYSKFGKYTNNIGKLPVTNINWFDAYVFSKWVGCSLPTEAEWELLSDKLGGEHWCCKETELSDFAWYSENSKGVLHEVAKKKPNSAGLYDMHGNVWEWVLDDYEEEYYLNSVRENPCCIKSGQYKVCRGGSIHAFSEMCRCEFRYYEPPAFKAVDLGFRVVKRGGR